MPTSSSRQLRGPEITSTQVVLREAKRLHRAATSDSLSSALPVLRRLLNAAAVPTQTLPSLYRLRSTVQRKHVLRTLAFEAGHASWEEYSRVLPLLDAQQLQQSFLSERGVASLKLWFPNEAGAEHFAAQNGGQAVRVRSQAVVLPVAQLAGAKGSN
ncbi:MAG: hypothetical protein ACRCV9_16145 [Burkholderiaceae bacterium]